MNRTGKTRQHSCQHVDMSSFIIVRGQMYCILTKYTVDDPMLKVGGGHILFCRRIYGGDKKKSTNQDIRRRLGCLDSRFDRYDYDAIGRPTIFI